MATKKKKIAPSSKKVVKAKKPPAKTIVKKEQKTTPKGLALTGDARILTAEGLKRKMVKMRKK